MRPRRESDEKPEFSDRKSGIMGFVVVGFLHYAS